MSRYTRYEHLEEEYPLFFEHFDEVFCNFVKAGTRKAKKLINSFSGDFFQSANQILQWKEDRKNGNYHELTTVKIDFIQNQSSDKRLKLLASINKILLFLLIGWPIYWFFSSFKWKAQYPFIIGHLLLIAFFVMLAFLASRKYLKKLKFLRSFKYAFSYLAQKNEFLGENLLSCVLAGDSAGQLGLLKKLEVEDVILLNLYCKTIADAAADTIENHLDVLYSYKRRKENQMYHNFSHKVAKENLKSLIVKFDDDKCYHRLMDYLNIGQMRQYLQEHGESIKRSPNTEDYQVGNMIKNPYPQEEISTFNRFSRWCFIIVPISLLAFSFLMRFNYVKDKLQKSKYESIMAANDPNSDEVRRINTVDIYVSAVNTELEENHVGNEWTEKTVINDKEIGHEKEVMSYCYGDSLFLYTYIEEDDNIPDVSTRIDTVRLGYNDLVEGKTVNVKSVVCENRGKYAGCCALWNSAYKFSLVNPDVPIYGKIEIGFSEVVSQLFL